MPGLPKGLFASRRGCERRASSKPEPAAAKEAQWSPGSEEAERRAILRRRRRRRQGCCDRSGSCSAALGDLASSRGLAPITARGCELDLFAKAVLLFPRRSLYRLFAKCCLPRFGFEENWFIFWLFRTFSFSLVTISSLLNQTHYSQYGCSQ